MSVSKTPAAGAAPKKPVSSKQPKVFDIRRPGRVLASPTSRPVIMGHAPSVQDSVLVGKPATFSPPKKSRLAIDPDEERELMDPTRKVTIQPAQGTAPASAAAKAVPRPTKTPATVEAKPAVPQPALPKPPIAPKETSQPIVPALVPPGEVSLASLELNNFPQRSPEPTSPPSFSGEAQASSRTEELQPTSHDSPQSSEELLAGTAAPEVDMSHAVISSHVTPRRRWWREVLVIIGLLLFVFAALDVLLDAGIFSAHGLPHTHLFMK